MLRPMNAPAVVVCLIVTVVTGRLVFPLFFQDQDDFVGCLGSAMTPDILSLFRGEFLPTLVADTGGSLLVAQETGRLRESFARVVDEFRQRYLLTYSPSDVEVMGWHEIEVRVSGRARRVQARRGYLR